MVRMDKRATSVMIGVGEKVLIFELAVRVIEGGTESICPSSPALLPGVPGRREPGI